MNRMSILPLAKYCGLVGTLQKKYGNSRAAVIGTYFHGLCEGKTKEFLPYVDEEELKEISSWIMPTFPEHAVHEKAVRFTMDYGGNVFCAFGEVPEEIVCNDYCTGHVDVHWIGIDEWGQKYVRVVDIKTGPPEFYSPESLQIRTYAAVLCRLLHSREDVEYAIPGVYYARTGEYRWGNLIHYYDTPEVLAESWKAACNIAETGTTGSHCDGCFQRLHCPEYHSVGAPEDIKTNDDALAAIIQLDALKKTYEAMEKRLRTYADMTGGIINGDKVWGPSTRRGRESVRVDELRAKLGSAADEFITTGKPYLVYRWLKK